MVMKSRRLSRACSMYGRDEKCMKKLVGNLNGRDHFGDQGID
jgi:hypothetical protein